uniref:Uncharacterized protein n=1 Tax=Anguilla anguilla TaxID=7936 RepID=A0A0E9VUV7_ANGAN
MCVCVRVYVFVCVTLRDMLWVCVYMCMLKRCAGVVSNTKLIFTSCFDLRSLSI